jgi:hypothetical protein
MLTDTGPLAAQTRTPFKFDEGVERYLDYLRSVGYSPSTLRKKRRVIGAFAQSSRHTSPERATRLLLQILDLERRGSQHDLVERRKALRDLHAGQYAAYLKTR